jgi:glycosyltransferase involved in cell wall biosynthesis
MPTHTPTGKNALTADPREELLREALFKLSVQQKELDRLKRIELSRWWKFYEAFLKYLDRRPALDSMIRSIAAALFRKTTLAKRVKSRSRRGTDTPGTLVFVSDAHIPEFDKNAGARCTYQYLQLMTELGMTVFFHPRDGENREPYATRLTDMGITILEQDVRGWLRKHGERITHFYLQRPSSVDILGSIRRFKSADAKIVYFAHDLHHLRTKREFSVFRDPVLLKEAAFAEFRERECFEAADVIQVVGSYERALVSSEYPDKSVLEIPLFFFPTIPPYSRHARKDLIFVGGFNHNPNRDAMDWFLAHVWTPFHARMPEVVLNLVGNAIPKDYGADIPGVTVHGWVDDQTLSEHYGRCRMMIVPLRFGAGVKGKVLEAMAHGLPVVSTPIGMEGLDETAQVAVVVEQSPQAWVEGLVKWYGDEDRLAAIAANAHRYVLEKNSRETAVSILHSSFGDL